jgi:hypothetical protein
MKIFLAGASAVIGRSLGSPAVGAGVRDSGPRPDEPRRPVPGRPSTSACKRWCR